MKKLFLSLLFAILPILGYGQAMIVNDPMNYVQITSMLEEGIEQTAKMEEQVSFLKNAKEKIDLVNDKIKSLQTIDRLITLGKSTIVDIKKTSDLISGMKDVKKEYVTATLARCTRYTSQIIDKISFIADIMTDDTFSLNDAERLNQIQVVMRDIEALAVKTHQTFQNVKRMEQRLNFLKSFK